MIKATEMARKVKSALLSKKGDDVLILDVRKISDVTDFYVIATGKNPPHLRALADIADFEMRNAGAKCFRRSGTPESQWIVTDFFEIVVHVFSENARSYYALERLWSDAPRIED